VAGYLILAEALAQGDAPQSVNFGPTEAELSVRDLLALWAQETGEALNWTLSDAPAMPEKSRLALDSGLARARVNWAPRQSTPQVVAATATWYAAWALGHDMVAASNTAIRDFLGI
jgi:CDP-glucose 4,6-dehydratase